MYQNAWMPSVRECYYVDENSFCSTDGVSNLYNQLIRKWAKVKIMVVEHIMLLS